MKHIIKSTLTVLTALAFSASALALPKTDEFKIEGNTSFRPEEKLTLWYTTPAAREQWEEYSMPLGNGELGASIFGGIKTDEIQFNEKTLWSGTSTDNNSYDDYGHYEFFGTILVDNLSEEFSCDGSKPVKNYHRELDLTTATAKVAYTSAAGTNYSRQYITSNPDNVVIARYTADKPGSISMKVRLETKVGGDNGKTKYEGNTATFSGKLQTISYNARIQVVATGGQTSCEKDGIVVKGADECLIILAADTDFDAYSKTFTSGTAKLGEKISKEISDAISKGWDAVYKDHVTDYQSLFNRSRFELRSENNMPTDKLIGHYMARKSGTEPASLMLEELYFAFGRYLAISSSRGVDLPSNLQGIWNGSQTPPWNSDIHSNINVQMNYWPVESTNLSELHLPFLNYIINMATNHDSWKRYAKESGQERGWTCYTENNIFGGVGAFMHEYVIANAWYCTHLWQHYRYTLDKDFLLRAFPTMLSATQFWLDRLIVDKTDGKYVCPQEYSPEHGPVEDGMPHAQQLVWELFDNTLKAVEILSPKRCGISKEEHKQLREYFANLDNGLAIEEYDGGWGADLNGIKKGDKILREWKYSTYQVGQNGHRHMSHAMCLYPFNQLEQGSELFNAMVNTLKMRGDASTGWSMGWKINLWARALDGNHAHDILELALRHHEGDKVNYMGGGGINFNLFDSHPPFQIDGNFGATAGIAEMLLQSHTEQLHILPALPDVWASGSVTGLKGIGDFEVSIKWEDSRATLIEVVNVQGQPCVVKYPGLDNAQISIDGRKIKPKKVGEDSFRIASKAGDKIRIEL